MKGFRRLWVVLFALLSALSELAVAQEPRVRTSLPSQDDVWVGQRVTLVVDLLAPGFFADAPSFDLPDPAGMIIVPPRGRPVVSSEQVDGASYTVQRHELSVFARRAGGHTVPSFTVRFGFKRQALDRDAIVATVKTTPVSFTAKSPPGAEKLGSVISARNLTVVEAWKPEPGPARTGDAFTRTITYAAPDVPAMAFPPFPTGKIDGLGVYPKAPEVLDREERGELQGERRDAVSYVCERPGTFVIPAVRMTWWDLEAKALRKIEFPARTFQVAANPSLASATDGKERSPVDLLSLRMVAIALALIAAIFGGYQVLQRHGRRWVQPFLPIHLAPLNPRAGASDDYRALSNKTNSGGRRPPISSKS